MAEGENVPEILPGADLAKGIQAKDEIEGIFWRFCLGKVADGIDGKRFAGP
jgi:hypothetical protein